MERIKILLENVIAAAEIRKEEDIEVVARVLLASIEKGCVNELSDKVLEFTEQKLTERMMQEN